MTDGRTGGRIYRRFDDS